MSAAVFIYSFSFHHPVVDERAALHGGGFVFDCRCLHNPGREERFMRKSGLDGDVCAVLESLPEVSSFLQHVEHIVYPAILKYDARGFESLSVGFGCTGGQHRSVYCAEKLASRLSETLERELTATHLRLPLLDLGSL